MEQDSIRPTEAGHKEVAITLALDIATQTIKELRDALSQVKEYLLDHEQDIAYGENDFGELREAFKVLFGREAKP